MSVEGIFKGITRAKKEGNSIEGTGGQKRGQTRNCNLPCKKSVNKCKKLHFLNVIGMQTHLVIASHGGRRSCRNQEETFYKIRFKI